jgi:uncharacterized protein
MYILHAATEWDERKRLANIAKHSIDFIRAAKIFEGWVLVVGERIHGSGEKRFSALGETENLILYVVYTWRGESLRIIIARRAGPHERKKYYASRDARSP